jgi:alpha-N-acetylglucosamine transferase
MKIKKMVSRNLTIPYNFVCLSNTDVPCERIPLIHDWPGWWSKIELFRPGLFEDWVLYLDLDVLIMQNIDDLVKYAMTSTSEFVIAKGEQRDGKYVYQRDGVLVDRHYQGSVMMFRANTYSRLYTMFNPEIISKYHSDETYMGQMLPDLPTFPEKWIKRLDACPKGIPSKETKIVLCIPDKNDVAVEKYPWVKDIWR